MASSDQKTQNPRAPSAEKDKRERHFFFSRRERQLIVGELERTERVL